jgi:hypothetical protein
MQMLIAQAGRFDGRGRDEVPPEVIVVIVIFVLVILAIALTIHIFYLLTLHRCYSLIRPRNRLMEPAMVWLNLVPFLNIVWIFFTTQRLAESLRDEYHDRRLQGDGDFGKSLGLIYPILNLVGIIPYIGALFGLAAFICWIIYWVKIAGYNRELREDDLNRSDGREWADDQDAPQ